MIRAWAAAFVVLSMAAGCAKAEPKAEPKPEPKPEPRPEPQAEPRPEPTKKIPQVHLETPTVGDIETPIIRRVIRTHRDEWKPCFGDRAGNVVVDFTITPEGSVVGARVKTATVDDESVAACVVDALGTWTFPKPRGGGVLQVSYRFELPRPD